MKNKFLTFLFYKYQSFFEEMMVRELILKTPSTIEEPALDFLAQGKERLEKWLLYQSYYLQRRSAGDSKNADVFQGAMLYLAVFLRVINQKKKIISTNTEKKVEDKEKNSLNAIEALREKRVKK